MGVIFLSEKHNRCYRAFMSLQRTSTGLTMHDTSSSAEKAQKFGDGSFWFFTLVTHWNSRKPPKLRLEIHGEKQPIFGKAWIKAWRPPDCPSGG
jgi:hypothetical protein